MYDYDFLFGGQRSSELIVLNEKYRLAVCVAADVLPEGFGLL